MAADSDMKKNRKIVNTLTYLKATNIYITDTECTFVIEKVLKHSRSKYCQKSRAC